MFFSCEGKKSITEQILYKGIDNCFISEITVAELLYGVECDDRNFSENRKKVNEFIEILTVIPIKNAFNERHLNRLSNIKTENWLQNYEPTTGERL